MLPMEITVEINQSASLWHQRKSSILWAQIMIKTYVHLEIYVITFFFLSSLYTYFSIWWYFQAITVTLRHVRMEVHVNQLEQVLSVDVKLVIMDRIVNWVRSTSIIPSIILYTAIPREKNISDIAALSLFQIYDIHTKHGFEWHTKWALTDTERKWL